MPAKCERKIHEIGGSSVVVLPRDWIRGMNVKAGDILELVYDEVVTVRKKAAADSNES